MVNLSYTIEVPDASVVTKTPAQISVFIDHISSKTVPADIKFVGKILDQNKLAEYYSLADLCVVTSKRETFGMTVAESLCCGTPVVGFKSGGSESIAIKEYTEFFDFGDVAALKSAIENKWLGYKTDSNSVEIEKESKKIYNCNIMAKEYCDVYKELKK